MYYEPLIVVALVVVLYFAFRVLKIEAEVRKLRGLLMAEKGQAAPVMPKADRRNRYVVFQLITSAQISKTEEVSEIIESSLRNCMGEVRLSDCRPTLVFYSQKRKRGVIRTYRDCYEEVISCLSATRGRGAERMLFIPIKTTGTLKRARWYLFDKRLAR